MLSLNMGIKIWIWWKTVAKSKNNNNKTKQKKQTNKQTKNKWTRKSSFVTTRFGLVNPRLTKGGGGKPPYGFPRSLKNAKQCNLVIIISNLLCGHFDGKKMGVPPYPGVRGRGVAANLQNMFGLSFSVCTCKTPVEILIFTTFKAKFWIFAYFSPTIVIFRFCDTLSWKFMTS